jgi:hypothetical protein
MSTRFAADPQMAVGVHDAANPVDPAVRDVQLQTGGANAARVGDQRLGVLGLRRAARLELRPWQLARHDVRRGVSKIALLLYN